MAASVIAVVLNGLALVITATKTASQVYNASLLGLKRTLSEILLRDGKYLIFITMIVSITRPPLGSMFFLLVLIFRLDGFGIIFCFIAQFWLQT